jgi:hypothetical protein
MAPWGVAAAIVATACGLVPVVDVYPIPGAPSLRACQSEGLEEELMKEACALGADALIITGEGFGRMNGIAGKYSPATPPVKPVKAPGT